MKKVLIALAKALCFVVAWAGAIGILGAIPALQNPPFGLAGAAAWRLWWELLPLGVALLVTVFFTRIVERGKVTLPLRPNAQRAVPLGLGLGVIWLGVPVLLLMAMDVLRFTYAGPVAGWWLWLLAILCNAAMQEILVRGYLFEMLCRQGGRAVGIVVTTLLFTAMHGGAFEAGWLAVLNVVSMSVFISLLLLYTGSIWAPILAHFVWNAGGRMLGVISLADDYPSLWNPVFAGDSLFTGGAVLLEGSVVVLGINIILCIVFASLRGRRGRRR